MLFDVWYVTGLILLIFPISNHLQDCRGLLCLVPRVVAYIYDRVDCIKNFLNKNVCESCSFWPFTDIIPLLTSFTEVEQEAVMQENAMLQVNNVWLSLENICDSCSHEWLDGCCGKCEQPGCGQCIRFLHVGKTQLSSCLSLWVQGVISQSKHTWSIAWQIWGTRPPAMDKLTSQTEILLASHFTLWKLGKPKS